MEHFNIDEEMISLLTGLSSRELISFAILIEDPISDEQIELYIFASLLIAKNLGFITSAKSAIDACRSWISTQPEDGDDSDESERRVAILSLAENQIK